MVETVYNILYTQLFDLFTNRNAKPDSDSDSDSDTDNGNNNSILKNTTENILNEVIDEAFELFIIHIAPKRESGNTFIISN